MHVGAVKAVNFLTITFSGTLYIVSIFFSKVKLNLKKETDIMLKIKKSFAIGEDFAFVLVDDKISRYTDANLWIYSLLTLEGVTSYLTSTLVVPFGEIPKDNDDYTVDDERFTITISYYGAIMLVGLDCHSTVCIRVQSKDKLFVYQLIDQLNK